jgi:hypothetical protein
VIEIVQKDRVRLGCGSTPFGATEPVHRLAERSKHRVHRGLPAVAELERSKLKDFVACSRFPSTAGALHALAHQALARRFDGAASNRKAVSMRFCVTHRVFARAEVSNRIA